MHALIIDLNNFSRYPTLSVGYLTAILRNNNTSVDVLSPFSRGVKSYPRTIKARKHELILNYLKYWSAVTPNKFIYFLRKILKRNNQVGQKTDKEIILTHFKQFLANSPDIVLISTYTMYLDICQEISEICFTKNIPVIIGGSIFVDPNIAKLWSSLEGVSAIYAGEPEFHLIAMINELIQKKQISTNSGVYIKEASSHQLAPPLSPLDKLPFPDFSDFPWGLYPNKIIPIMTGRGCHWDICTFCSDVTTASGRSYRSRGIDNVIDEIKYQSKQFDSNLIAFLDLKLNSNVTLWRELISTIPSIVPNAQWTASIHVDTRTENGLSRKDLFKAREAGLVRLTFGLESGSPKVLKSMAKGIKLQKTSTFLKDASDAGISIRVTCIIGYPGEKPEDIDLTTKFISAHFQYIERIVLNRFTLMPSTPIHTLLKAQPQDFPEIQLNEIDLSSGVIPHTNNNLSTLSYYKSTFRLMKAIHKINQNPLMESASEFEGVM